MDPLVVERKSRGVNRMGLKYLIVCFTAHDFFVRID